jgi:heat shock protein HslJ
MITLRSVAAGLALLLLMSAGAACNAAAPQPTDRTFLSVAVTDGGAARPLVAGTRIRLDFRGNELGANAGCNSIGGTYSIQNGALVLDAAGMTEMGCDQLRHDQDDWLIEFLSSRPAFSISGDELTLAGTTVVLRLMDRRIVEPDVALVGPTWTVDAIASGDAVSSIPGGAVATLRFHPDGSVDVNTGCNQGSGTWKSVGATVEISQLMLTKRACDQANGGLEGAVLSLIDGGPMAAEIEASSLRLQAGQNGLHLRAS